MIQAAQSEWWRDPTILVQVVPSVLTLAGFIGSIVLFIRTSRRERDADAAATRSAASEASARDAALDARRELAEAQRGMDSSLRAIAAAMADQAVAARLGVEQEKRKLMAGAANVFVNIRPSGSHRHTVHFFNPPGGPAAHDVRLEIRAPELKEAVFVRPSTGELPAQGQGVTMRWPDDLVSSEGDLSRIGCVLRWTSNGVALRKAFSPTCSPDARDWQAMEASTRPLPKEIDEP